MAGDFETMLREQAQPLLEPDEEILAAVVAQPRGTAAASSGVNIGASTVGSVWAGKSRGGAGEVGLKLATPMALALTQKRLVVLGLETSAMGKPKGVSELVSAVPLGEVESISIRRLLLGKTMKIAMQGGGAVKLEMGAGQDAKGLAAQFERAKAAA